MRAQSEKSNNRLALEDLSIEGSDWSRLAGNGDINCNSGSQNPVDQYFPQSRFRRSFSRFSKRQNNDRCTSPEFQDLQREAQKKTPVRQPGNVAKPARIPTGERMRNMDADDQLMLIITQPHTEGKPNPDKCNHNLSYQVPICAPNKPGKMQTSPQSVVVPSRFCKFSLRPFFSALPSASSYSRYLGEGQDLPPYSRLTGIFEIFLR